jgi:Transposase DDE domain group 1
MRLILHTAAYWLMLAVRNAIPRPQPLASGEFSTIPGECSHSPVLRLLKIAVRIEETASRVWLAFAANCPDATLFRGLVGTLILRPTVETGGLTATVIGPRFKPRCFTTKTPGYEVSVCALR